MRDLVPTTIALGKTGPSPKTASLCPAHSFLLVILVGQSSAWGSYSSQSPLAIRGWITTESQSPETPDCWCEHSKVATQTSQTWKWDQSTQVSWCTLPLPGCQEFKTYWAEDLCLSFPNLQNAELPTIPEIRMSPSGVASFWQIHHGNTARQDAVGGELSQSISPEGQISIIFEYDFLNFTCLSN